MTSTDVMDEDLDQTDEDLGLTDQDADAKDASSPDKGAWGKGGASYTSESAPAKAAAPRPKRQAVGPAKATGRRKTAIARVSIKPGTGQFTVNKRPLDEYFPNKVHQQEIMQAMKVCDVDGVYDVTVTVIGGGISGQAGAVRHGLARALNAVDTTTLRPLLKRAGFLTRDARAKERKKYGLKKARKAPQFSKR